jgi:preprotein translocase subunit SecG
MSILLPILTFVLIIVAIFLILVVLMQKAKSDGGMGAALGGGMTEATFGADTGNVLTKATINASILFFVLSFGLYLGWIYQLKHTAKGGGVLPTISAPILPPAPAPSAAPAPTVVMPAAPLAPLAPAATPAPASSKP